MVTTHAPTITPAHRVWPASFRSAAIVWSLIHVGYAAVTLVTVARRYGDIDPGHLMNAWRQWDANWYIGIANEGYGGPLGRSATAFLPLYPLLIHITDLVLPGGALPAALLVANAAGYGAFVIIHRLVATEFAETRLPKRTILYIAAFPTAFFLAAPYNMSLFLLLLAGSFLCMRQAKWFAAGLLGALAVATRSSGLLLVIVFVAEYLRQTGWNWRRIRPSIAWVLLMPAAFAGFMAHIGAVLGDATIPLTIQSEWDRWFEPPWTVLSMAIGRLTGTPPQPSFERQLINLMDLVLVIVFAVLLVLTVVGPWRFRRDQWTFTLLGAGLLAFAASFPMHGTAHPLMSASRFMLEIFPAFILLGIMTAARKWATWLCLIVALALQAVLLEHYLVGGWAG